ncbi:MAG: FadR/GntR family transcriptional regulator [Acidimicrobiales bacterium]
MGLTDEAIEKVRQLIISGELGPGDRLPPEAALAARLGLSRSSMREAAKALVHARVLDVRRGDGTYVTSLEPRLLLEGIGFAVELMGEENLVDVIEVRRLLEPAASELAAVRIDEDGLFELRTHLDRMRAAEDEAGSLVVHDVAFHERVALATGNETLASVLRGLATATVRARTWRAAVEANAARQTVAEHEDIYRALAAGDAHLARAVALVHVDRSGSWLREQLRGGPPPRRGGGQAAAGNGSPARRGGVGHVRPAQSAQSAGSVPGPSPAKPPRWRPAGRRPTGE